MKKISYFLASFFWLAPLPLLAQGTGNSEIMQDLLNFPGIEVLEEGERQVVKGSLQATLHLVLKHNSTIKSAVMGEEIAESALISARGRNVAEWDNRFSTSRSSTQSGSNDKKDTQTKDSPYKSYEITDSNVISTEVSKKSSTGIRYSASLADSASKRSSLYRIKEGGGLKSPEKEKNDTIHTSSLTFGMDIPIAQDWGRVNDLHIERSETDVERSKTGTAKAKKDLIDRFATIYWDLAGLWERRRVMIEAIQTSEKLVKESQVRSELGVGKPIDIKQNEIQLLKNQQSLLEIDNQIRDVEDQVKVALNLKTLPYGFLPGDRPQFRKVPFNFDELLKKTFATDFGLVDLQSSFKNNSFDLVDAENKDASNLDLSLQYSLSASDKDLSKTFGEYGDTELNGYSIGLTWSIPFSSRQNEEEINKTKIARAQLEIDMENAKDALFVNLKSLQRNLLHAERDIKKSRVIRELSEELLEQEIEKQKLGQSTGLQVSQVQQELISAQSDEIQSLINFEKIYLSLLILTGDVYAKYELPQTL